MINYSHISNYMMHYICLTRDQNIFIIPILLPQALSFQLPILKYPGFRLLSLFFFCCRDIHLFLSRLDNNYCLHMVKLSKSA